MDVVTESVAIVTQALNEALETVAKRATVAVFGNLLDSVESGGTPRKSGYAAACWIPSIGTPSGSTGGTKQSPSFAPGQAGLQEVDRFALWQGDLYITNNCEYIVQLAFDSPHAGFVESCISRATKTL